MRILILQAVFVIWTGSNLVAQDSDFKIIFSSRAYQRVGRSYGQWWEMSLPDRRMVKLSDTGRTRCSASSGGVVRQTKIIGEGKLPAWSADGERLAYVDIEFTQLRIVQVEDEKVLATIRLPERSEHWNYPQSISWSPDGKTLLVGAEAGSSDSHFEDYWLLDWNRPEWRYAGGGNDAKWSPDSSRVLWSTPRALAPLGRIHVWVAHLVLLDVKSLRQQVLTSGVSYDSDFSWCTR